MSPIKYYKWRFKQISVLFVLSIFGIANAGGLEERYLSVPVKQADPKRRYQKEFLAKAKQFEYGKRIEIEKMSRRDSYLLQDGLKLDPRSALRCLSKYDLYKADIDTINAITKSMYVASAVGFLIFTPAYAIKAKRHKSSHEKWIIFVNKYNNSLLVSEEPINSTSIKSLISKEGRTEPHVSLEENELKNNNQHYNNEYNNSLLISEEPIKSTSIKSQISLKERTEPHVDLEENNLEDNNPHYNGLGFLIPGSISFYFWYHFHNYRIGFWGRRCV